jgi:hypothetical protein
MPIPGTFRDCSEVAIFTKSSGVAIQSSDLSPGKNRLVNTMGYNNPKSAIQDVQATP